MCLSYKVPARVIYQHSVLVYIFLVDLDLINLKVMISNVQHHTKQEKKSGANLNSQCKGLSKVPISLGKNMADFGEQ